MAHYAFLNDNNVVTEVIVGVDETELIEGKDPETWYSEFRGQRCVRTSYNNRIRVRFAGIGMTYHDDLDAFIRVKCHSEAILNEATADWDCNHTDHEMNYGETN